MNAKNVNEAVSQMEDALANFHKENGFYNRLFSKLQVEDAWENLRMHCQQLSGWIEGGFGVTQEMKPDLCKKLYATEAVLIQFKKYSRGKVR